MIVQLSDLHLSDDDPAPEESLRRVLTSVANLRPAPVAVLVTGDIAHAASAAEYEQARALMSALHCPVHVMSGNHDARAALRRAFSLPGAAEDPICDVIDAGELRVIMADTSVPEQDAGALDNDWLLHRLRAAPQRPTLIATHHPPIEIGIAALDAIGLVDSDRVELSAILRQSAQVVGIVAGHVHRAVAGAIAGVPVVCAPSTWAQIVLDLGGDSMGMSLEEPPGYVVHDLVGGALVSHFVLVP